MLYLMRADGMNGFYKNKSENQKMCVCSYIPVIFSSVMYCSDPGHVEHSTRSLSDPKLLVGTTIQYSCNPGFILQGGATITCYGREPGTPVWTSRLPHCVCEYQKHGFKVFLVQKQGKTWHVSCFYPPAKASSYFIDLVGCKISVIWETCHQDRQLHMAVNWGSEPLSWWLCDLTWVGLCDF